MELSGEKKGEKSAEKGRGRPRKDTDPQKTAPLFGADNDINQAFSDTYDDSDYDVPPDDVDADGTVLGGGAFSIEDRMAVCARLARSSKSEQVRLNATIKYSELERELRLERGGEDLGEELAALLALVTDDPPGAVVRGV